MGLRFWAVMVVGVLAMAGRRQPKPWTPAEIAAAKAWEAERVAEGRCPWSGGVLAPIAGSPAAATADRRRCDICDCPGYPVTEVPRDAAQ